MPMRSHFAQRLEPILRDLVDRYGTPFHIYDESGIVETHQAMVRAFEGWPYRQYFAVKALPNPAVLRALLAVGSGFDCSSVIELRLAQAVGASGADIVFTSNNTSESEYASALRAGALITFDDRRYSERAAELPGVVSFRVAPHGASANSALMGGAGHSKFGVPRRDLVGAYAAARNRGATRFGIHGMTCANELDLARAVRAAEDLIETASMVEREAGIRFEYVNIGGGLGIPYRSEEEPLDFAAYAAAVTRALVRAFCGSRPRLLMECGRFVSGPHGVLVSRVVNRLHKEREIVGLDASMSALMRPAFYASAYHHISLPFAGARRSAAVDVVGSLCENMDRFAVDRVLPDPAEGDVVLIHDTGAHGHAMGFNYNGRLRPPELLLTARGDVVEIRRAETFEDYVSTVQWNPGVVRSGATRDAVE